MDVNLGNVEACCIAEVPPILHIINVNEPLPLETSVSLLKLLHLLREHISSKRGSCLGHGPLFRDAKLSKVVVLGTRDEAIEALAKCLAHFRRLALIIDNDSHQKIVDSLLL